jgi:flagellar biogenesis protein FliO
MILALPISLAAAHVLGQERPWGEETARSQPAPRREAILRLAGHQPPEAAERNETPERSPGQLGPRGAERTKPVAPAAEGAQRGTKGPHRPLLSTFASLAVVLGLFLLVTWWLRRYLPGGSAPPPADVLEVLGRANIGHKQPVYLVRFGKGLLLVATGASGGLETLAEVTDPEEAARLAGMCQPAHSKGPASEFRDFFRAAAAQPPRATKAEDRRG